LYYSDLAFCGLKIFPGEHSDLQQVDAVCLPRLSQPHLLPAELFSASDLSRVFLWMDICSGSLDAYTRGPRLSKEDQNWQTFGDFPRMSNPLYPFDIPVFHEKRD
jgi:hypothetical protein